jgi:hypothetical protein
MDRDGVAEEGQAIQNDVLCSSLFYAHQIQEVVCARLRRCADECVEDGQLPEEAETNMDGDLAETLREVCKLCEFLEPFVLPAYLTKVETNLQSIIIGILERQRHAYDAVFERVPHMQPMEEGRLLILTMRACVDECAVMSEGELVVQVCHNFKRILGESVFHFP